MNQNASQHSVHPTGGSRRVFRLVARLEAGSGKAALSRPTHPRVTHTVMPPLKKGCYMEYPTEVQEKIDFLQQYKVNDSLEVCHIVHMYPEGIAYPNGYYDSQYFTLVMFNTETMEKRTIEGRDGMGIETKENVVKFVRIFADGSTLVKFSKAVSIDIYQRVSVHAA